MPLLRTKPQISRPVMHLAFSSQRMIAPLVPDALIDTLRNAVIEKTQGYMILADSLCEVTGTRAGPLAKWFGICRNRNGDLFNVAASFNRSGLADVRTDAGINALPPLTLDDGLRALSQWQRRFSDRFAAQIRNGTAAVVQPGSLAHRERLTVAPLMIPPAPGLKVWF